MQQLLQYKPRLTGTRVMLAFVIAVLADVIQIPVNYSLTFFPQLRFINYAVDGLTMILTIGLLGFNWVLIPAAAFELLPISFSFPSWTASVAWAVWRRRNETAQSTPATPNTAGETSNTTTAPIKPEFFNPMKTLLKSVSFIFNARTSGLWILIITAALIGGLILHNHKQGRYAPTSWSGEAYAAPEPTFEYVANSRPQAKPLITVAPIENQVQGKNSDSLRVNPERVRFLVEDLFAKMDGVELLRPLPAQLRQPIAADLIVFVTLLDAADEAATFNAYKIAARTMETKCSLRVQVIRAADKSSVFATVLEGSQTEVRTAVANAPLSNDRILGAVKDALNELPANPEFQTALHGKLSPR